MNSETFLEEHSKFIYYYIYKNLNSRNYKFDNFFIEDLFQNFCIKLIDNNNYVLSKYDSEKGKVTTFLKKILDNFIIDELRKTNKHFKDIYIENNKLSEEEDLDIVLFKEDLKKIELSNILSSRELLIIKLFFFKEFTLKEISDFLKVKDSTVRVQKLNAIRKLKEYYE